ncbi:hypothetical protein T265_02344 [Opisthorchis viverrini]|uniref:Uncharacterized protein n=1 Tax=Opisthorchis viverrini TaxID=6198 RepID=A0A074ZWC0_OPIVI|nr:hypothetical protein T265_02344 [Opisthorchis viverrini]KER31436.1 hypothetical protein T265_02344 [Opisthorchis viverrini]
MSLHGTRSALHTPVNTTYIDPRKANAEDQENTGLVYGPHPHYANSLHRFAADQNIRSEFGHLMYDS